MKVNSSSNIIIDKINKLEKIYSIGGTYEFKIDSFSFYNNRLNNRVNTIIVIDEFSNKIIVAPKIWQTKEDWKFEYLMCGRIVIHSCNFQLFKQEVSRSGI